MRQHDVPESKCPACGYPHNQVTHEESDDPPSPGDVVVCSTCATTLVLTSDLGVRKLTPREFQAIPDDMKNELVNLVAFVITPSPSRRIH